MENSKGIKPAGLGKRFLAFLIDFVLVGLVTGLLFAFVTSTDGAKAMGGDEVIESINSYRMDTGLYHEVDGTPTGYRYFADPSHPSSSETGEQGQTSFGYELYFDLVYDFYTVFLPSDHGETYKIDAVDGIAPKDYYTWDRFCISVLGMPNPDAIVDFSEEESYSGAYFSYVLNSEKNAVVKDAKPVLRSSYLAKVVARDYDVIKTLKDYFFDESNNSGRYYNALALANTQTFCVELNNKYTVINWACFALAFEPIHLLTFLIIPLISKKGQTLGKMLMGFGLLGKDGYTVKPLNKVLHVAIVYLEGLLVLLPVTMMGIAAYVLVTMIDYLIAALGKGQIKQAIHDKLSGTIVIDIKESTWFSSKEAEESYYRDHPEERPIEIYDTESVTFNAIEPEKAVEPIENKDPDDGFALDTDDIKDLGVEGIEEAEEKKDGE